jgi:hypothetical protein
VETWRIELRLAGEFAVAGEHYGEKVVWRRQCPNSGGRGHRRSISGDSGLAETVAEATLAAAHRSGFRECYEPD